MILAIAAPPRNPSGSHADEAGGRPGPPGQEAGAGDPVAPPGRDLSCSRRRHKAPGPGLPAGCARRPPCRASERGPAGEGRGCGGPDGQTPTSPEDLPAACAFRAETRKEKCPNLTSLNCVPLHGAGNSVPRTHGESPLNATSGWPRPPCCQGGKGAAPRCQPRPADLGSQPGGRGLPRPPRAPVASGGQQRLRLGLRTPGPEWPDLFSVRDPGSGWTPRLRTPPLTRPEAALSLSLSLEILNGSHVCPREPSSRSILELSSRHADVNAHDAACSHRPRGFPQNRQLLNKFKRAE